MSRTALILTKNVLAEDKLQRLFQKMDFEVMVTNRTDPNKSSVLKNKAIVKYFDLIVFSVTVDDFEIKELIKQANLKSKTIFSVYDGPEKNNPRTSIASHTVWSIHDSAGLSTLQRTINLSGVKVQTTELREEEIELVDEEKLINFVHSLSHLESKVIWVLAKNHGNSVSKKQLIEAIWGEVTQSKLAQTSTLVGKLKIKLDKHLINSVELVTSWGKGYSLRGENFSKLLKEPGNLYNSEMVV